MFTRHSVGANCVRARAFKERLTVTTKSLYLTSRLRSFAAPRPSLSFSSEAKNLEGRGLFEDDAGGSTYNQILVVTAHCENTDTSTNFGRDIVFSADLCYN